MLLGKSTQSLVVVQGLAKVTVDCDFSVKYLSTIRQAILAYSFFGYTNGITIKEMLAAPPDNGSYDINEIVIHNTDSITHTYLVSIKDGSNYYVQRKLSLTTKQTAIYTPVYGWTIG